VLRVLLALRAKGIVNAVARRAIARKPVAAWGLQQGMHVTGTLDGLRLLRSTTRFSTRRVSQLVTADVLLLAGADDHYVPLKQLRRQAANLIRARSVTTRTFTAAEQASNHCQVGNIGAAVRVIQGWLALSTISRMAEKADAAEELARHYGFAHHQRCAVILECDGVVRRLRVGVKGLQLNAVLTDLCDLDGLTWRGVRVELHGRRTTPVGVHGNGNPGLSCPENIRPALDSVSPAGPPRTEVAVSRPESARPDRPPE